MHRQTRPVAGLALFVLLLGLALGCRQEVPPLFRRNQPPETTLTVVPEDSARGFYRYHVYWRGEDTDGHVVRYIFAITDTLNRDGDEDWNPQIAEDRERGVYSTKSDSVFVFNSARGRQALHIAAIDDFGRRDPSPARAFFRIVDNGLPRVQFLDVQGFRSGAVLPPCGAAEPCTIPTYTSFKIRFTGTTRNNRIVGFQWQGIRPTETNPEPFQPGGADSLFLGAGRDTCVSTLGDCQQGGDTLYALRGDVVSVYYYSEHGDSITPGNFVLRARVRDEARLESLLSQAQRRVVLNYDPDTWLYRVPACDCPNPPLDCAQRPPAGAGWITGVDQTAWTDSTQWLLFCEGDTLPQRSHARFFSRGQDDRRDVPKQPEAGLRPVGYAARFAWVAGRPPQQLLNINMPFSSEYPAASHRLPPAYDDGGFWFRNGWGSDRFPGICPFDFTYYVAAVDENAKRDGTPDSLRFYVSGSPAIDPDSVQVPLVIVLVPKCRGGDPRCPNPDSLRQFGPDTLRVLGVWEEDRSTPMSLGANRFVFPFRAQGFDHPRDRDPNLYPDPDKRGRIRSWYFTFDCAGECEDIAIPGEGIWRGDVTSPSDPPGRQVFDDALPIRVPLDTLCSRPCTPYPMAVLPARWTGTFQFILQGRETEAVGQVCLEPSDLGPTPAQFNRPVAEQGRTTQLLVRNVTVRQYQDVAPYVPVARPAAAAARTARKGWER